jgi:hypothetical protein
MWDFMDPLSNGGSRPVWEWMDYPILVFTNGMAPPLKRLDSIEPEMIDTYGPDSSRDRWEYRNTNGKRVKVRVPGFGLIRKRVTKIQAFSEYIISDRYRLYAVIMNRGSSPNLREDGGGHYNAYVRPFGDRERWYIYDDMGGVWKLTPKKTATSKKGELPEDAFRGENYSRPEMFFYERVRLTDYRQGWEDIFSEFHEDIQNELYASPRYFSGMAGPLKDIKSPTYTKPQSPLYSYTITPPSKQVATSKALSRRIENSQERDLLILEKVPRGKIFTELSSGVYLYGYSQDSFVVHGRISLEEADKLTKLGGVRKNRLFFHLSGGFVFPKSSLSKVLEFYSSD